MGNAGAPSLIVKDQYSMLDITAILVESGGVCATGAPILLPRGGVGGSRQEGRSTIGREVAL